MTSGIKILKLQINKIFGVIITVLKNEQEKYENFNGGRTEAKATKICAINVTILKKLKIA